MAINKDANGYTIIFTIVMVVIVGAGLAAVTLGLKVPQDKNSEIRKKMDILSALKVEDVTRSNAEKLYDTYVKTDECLVLDAEGNEISGVEAFDVDIKKQFRDKKRPVEKREYPLYVANVDGAKKYVIPVVGSGLWGPIWGYIAVNEDKTSILELNLTIKLKLQD